MARAGEGKWSSRYMESRLKVSGVGGMGVADAYCRVLPEDGGGRVDGGGGRFRAVVSLQDVIKMWGRGGLSVVVVGCQRIAEMMGLGGDVASCCVLP